MLAPIPQPDRLGLLSLPAITFGAGCFSGAYNDNAPVDVAGLVKRAYDLGIRSFDTSPYYGDSETLLGNGLRELFATGVSRDDIFIMTKCGRIGVWEFDYHPDSIRKSVLRSCERLGVDRLDVVYMHDVEFVGVGQVLGAAAALFQLKDEGVIGHVGISAYPLQVLDFLAREILRSQRPLDVVLSYSHYNIQNTTLIPQVKKFKALGIQSVLSASPLSMGLLKEGGPPEWHPASSQLKQRVLEAIDCLQDSDSDGYTLANIAVGYALKNARSDGLGSTVIGFCAIEEIHEAVQLYWEVMSDDNRAQDQRELLEVRVAKALGPCLNETWPSPPEIGRLADPNGGRVDKIA